MTVRFVLDESSWASATEAGADALTHAVDQLLERLDVARERGEGVAKHMDYYETELGHGVQLFSVLFEDDYPVKFDRDDVERLRLALDRVIEFDDSELVEYDAEIEGSVRFAPGVVWSHACCSQQCQIAVLPLPLGKVPHGRVPVTVAGDTIDIAFVTEEAQHVEFFRSVIELENADEMMFERVAPSAFPALEWADNVWQGLGDFSRPYIAIRRELIRGLGGLNDHGAICFHQFLGGDQSQLPNVLSAKIGCETSDENGRTKAYRPSQLDRTRRHLGTDKVFWWHVKLRRPADRIYFLYESPPTGSHPLEHGRIVVGLFKDHCILLPN